jgi:hypothetical protein
MAQKEEFTKYNYGGANYWDKNNIHNLFYFTKQYYNEHIRDKDSTIIKDLDNKIIGFIIDIGLTHSEHKHSMELNNYDRLFINKIDNNDFFSVDYFKNLSFKYPDNLTSNDFKNRIIRIAKMVDRDIFHMQLDGMQPKRHYYLLWNYVNWACDRNYYHKNRY